MDFESIEGGSVPPAAAILGEDIMKIIKKGKKKHFFVIQFQCYKCGCVFEADDTEYASVSKDGTYYAVCHCPCCDESLRKFDAEKTIKNWDNIPQKVQVLQSNGTRFEKRGLW